MSSAYMKKLAEAFCPSAVKLSREGRLHELYSDLSVEKLASEFSDVITKKHKTQDLLEKLAGNCDGISVNLHPYQDTGSEFLPETVFLTDLHKLAAIYEIAEENPEAIFYHDKIAAVGFSYMEQYADAAVEDHAKLAAEYDIREDDKSSEFFASPKLATYAKEFQAHVQTEPVMQMASKTAALRRAVAICNIGIDALTLAESVMPKCASLDTPVHPFQKLAYHLYMNDVQPCREHKVAALHSAYELFAEETEVMD